MVPTRAHLSPAAFRIEAIRNAVLLLPFVPVMRVLARRSSGRLQTFVRSRASARRIGGTGAQATPFRGFDCRASTFASKRWHPNPALLDVQNDCAFRWGIRRACTCTD